MSNEPEFITLQENLNAARLWEEIEANGSRAANSELLQHFHKEILKKLKSGRGRHGVEKEEAIVYWNGVADKLQKHEACARSLLDRMVDQISQTARK